MSGRPTPIVDSCEFTVPFAGKVIVSKTARRLERERDDYKEAFEIASRSADDQMFQKRDAERERDEARRERDELRSLLVSVINNGTDGIALIESKASLDFLRHVPSECASVKRQRDEARQEWGKASMDAAQMLSEKTKIMAERDEARELALKFRDALVSIEEYWNRDQNETAMADACWHAVNMAHDALAEMEGD